MTFLSSCSPRYSPPSDGVSSGSFHRSCGSGSKVPAGRALALKAGRRVVPLLQPATPVELTRVDGRAPFAPRAPRRPNNFAKIIRRRLAPAPPRSHIAPLWPWSSGGAGRRRRGEGRHCRDQGPSAHPVFGIGIPPRDSRGGKSVRIAIRPDERSEAGGPRDPAGFLERAGTGARRRCLNDGGSALAARCQTAPGPSRFGSSPKNTFSRSPTKSSIRCANSYIDDQFGTTATTDRRTNSFAACYDVAQLPGLGKSVRSCTCQCSWRNSRKT